MFESRQGRRKIKMQNVKCKIIKDRLVKFIREEVGKTGLENGIIGISGGLDSSVVAFLASRALGKEHCIGVIMPYKNSSEEAIEDAMEIIKILGIRSNFYDITPQIDAYFEKIGVVGGTFLSRYQSIGVRKPLLHRIRKGNKIARERMSILYDISAKEKGIVIGTGNKTELYLGYGTIYGDMACAIAPLGDLYKTQVRELAGFLGVPDKIIKKKPTADLWPGQTDEGEIGYSYDEIDNLLYHIIDMKYSRERVIEAGFKSEIVNRVNKMIEKSEFKRRLPVIAKIL